MSFSRAHAMCWAEMSASVQCVAIRTLVTPSAFAAFRSAMVPMPGSSSVVSRAVVSTSAAAAIQSASAAAPCP